MDRQSQRQRACVDDLRLAFGSMLHCDEHPLGARGQIHCPTHSRQHRRKAVHRWRLSTLRTGLRTPTSALTACCHWLRVSELMSTCGAGSMVDYYAILSRAIDAAEAGDRSWRRNLYDRARRTLTGEMRARRPPPGQAEIARELAVLEAAIKRIEAERARSENAESDPAALPVEPNQSPLP